MQLAMCFVLLVASALAGAFTCDGSSLQLRSQHSLDSSLRSKAFGRVLSSKDPCVKLPSTVGNVCTGLASDCCRANDEFCDFPDRTGSRKCVLFQG